MAAIEVDRLEMTYRAPVRTAGLRAAMRSLVHREMREIPAVRGVSFQVEEGEIVGLLGPNGAGKTTTLKILSGILHPTGGSVSVLGYQPARREAALLRQIAMVRGSRPLSAPGELTVHDVLAFQQVIYEVEDDAFRRNLALLDDVLGLSGLLERQVRALSLGERMRAGLALSLVYRPRVLFLDEPSIGLDVVATTELRRFIADYGRETGATIILTSHAMGDVESLCKRVVLIDRGTLGYDGDIVALSRTLFPVKLLTVSLAREGMPDLAAYPGVEVTAAEGNQLSLRVPRAEVPQVTARLLTDSALEVVDLTVSDPPLEMVIDRVYRQGVAA